MSHSFILPIFDKRRLQKLKHEQKDVNKDQMKVQSKKKFFFRCWDISIYVLHHHQKKAKKVALKWEKIKMPDKG